MTILEELCADIDWRNGELAELKVILHKVNLTETQRTTYARYIIPAIYALWEGFIKRSLELYSKEINNAGVPITNLHENLLTHAITSDDKLSLDKSRTNFNTQREFSLYICSYMGKAFPVGNKIPLKSNVNSEVLGGILQRFNLGEVDKKKSRGLDKLLLFRNAIAHGDNSMPVKEEIIDEFSQLIQWLMQMMLDRIESAIVNKTYLSTGNSF